MWSELRNGSGLFVGLAVMLVGAALLYVRHWYVPWVGIEMWVGRWGPLAAAMRTILAVLIPIVVAAAAWQGGRERRRRIDDQVASTPRPVWQRTVGSWLALTAAACGALLLVWLSAVVFVAPHATYNGGGWWWTLAIAFLSVASAAAVGLAAGRLIPFRFVAPVAGIAAYFYMEILTNPGIPDSLIWLSPSNLTYLYFHPTQHLEPSLHVQQALWFGGVGLAALVLAGARWKWLAVIPGVLAITGATLIVGGEGDERWQSDPMAQELVCSATEPGVCLPRVHAFLMDDLVPAVLDHFEVWEGVEGMPDRVVDGASKDVFDYSGPAEGDVDFYFGDFVGWNGGLTDDPWLVKNLAGSIVARRECDRLDEESLDSSADDPWAAIPLERDLAGTVAYGWAIQDPTAGSPVFDNSGNPIDPVANPDIEALLRLPEAEQKAWMSNYLAAAKTCDDVVFASLVSALR